MHAWFLPLPSHNKGEGSLDNSLNRNSKDFEKSKVGFDFSLLVSFSRVGLIDSLPLEERGQARREGISTGRVDALVVLRFPLCTVLSLSGICM